MKGQQRGPVQRTQSIGLEVSPTMVLVSTVSFVLAVILLHFYGKLIGK